MNYLLYVIWLKDSCFITGSREGDTSGYEHFFDDKETIAKIRRLENKQNMEMHKLLDEIIEAKHSH